MRSDLRGRLGLPRHRQADESPISEQGKKRNSGHWSITAKQNKRMEFFS